MASSGSDGPSRRVTTEPARPPHERVETLAYRLWELRGSGHGHDQGDWYEAERRLVGRETQAAGSR